MPGCSRVSPRPVTCMRPTPAGRHAERHRHAQRESRRTIWWLKQSPAILFGHSPNATRVRYLRLAGSCAKGTQNAIAVVKFDPPIVIRSSRGHFRRLGFRRTDLSSMRSAARLSPLNPQGMARGEQASTQTRCEGSVDENSNPARSSSCLCQRPNDSSKLSETVRSNLAATRRAQGAHGRPGLDSPARP